jgi:hypothetical protein
VNFNLVNNMHPVSKILKLSEFVTHLSAALVKTTMNNHVSSLPNITLEPLCLFHISNYFINISDVTDYVICISV